MLNSNLIKSLFFFFFFRFFARNTYSNLAEHSLRNAALGRRDYRLDDLYVFST